MGIELTKRGYETAIYLNVRIFMQHTYACEVKCK